MTTPPQQSPHLLATDRSALIVVDVQEKLLPVIADQENVLERAVFLTQAAKMLEVATLYTEQYPKGLGRTVPALAKHLDRRIEKLSFSAGVDEELLRWLDSVHAEQVLLAGIEAHVCVAQTALDLDSAGYDVYVAVDAVGSRRPVDKEVAMQRLARLGVTLTTAEAAAFEWAASAEHPQFKSLSALVSGKAG